MPPRASANHYDTIDFTSLALQYPAFARQLKANGQLDFSDPESVRQLSISLLDRDFGLAVTLPPDRLCPPVPNRFNYIIFIQRLLDSTSPSFRGDDAPDPQRVVRGVDIGTGASAIYPLLGTRQFANWTTVFATEIDQVSWASAAENIARNGLSDRIKLLDRDVVAANSPLLIPTKALFARTTTTDSSNDDEEEEEDDDDDDDDVKIDFLMTNPPFYGSTDEMAASARLKARPPNSSCTGSVGEMVYQYGGGLPPTTAPASPADTALWQALAMGGEVAFTAQLLQESTSPALRRRIQWFSAMVGKLSSLPPLISLVHQFHAQLYHHHHSNNSIPTTTGANYAVTEFVQGQKTRRWCLAWSWTPLRPSVAVARGIGASPAALEKRLLPAVTEFDFAFALQSVAAVSVTVHDVMQELVAEATIHDSEDDDSEETRTPIIRWQWKSKLSMGLAIVMRDCWSRKARRGRGREIAAGSGRLPHHTGTDNDDDDEPALVIKISVNHRPTTTTNKAETIVRTRWLQGFDSVLFESFCGWVKRKVEAKVKGPS